MGLSLVWHLVGNGIMLHHVIPRQSIAVPIVMIMAIISMLIIIIIIIVIIRQCPSCHITPFANRLTTFYVADLPSCRAGPEWYLYY